ncbi:MAG: hypothetical protein C4538_01710 [Nitrospiraceae bacterium]|nr:MAG: hypothetical protein C4538_01710 [Nitrospiraceae bacterium]
MIKTTAITSVAVIMMLVCASTSLAGDAWEMIITAYVNDAENRLIIGQRPDAREGIDGEHDVPALLAGDIMAYLELEGQEYWKDMRETCLTQCVRTWNVFVESELIGETVGLEWDAAGIPDDIAVTLTDTLSGSVIDMKMEEGISYENTGDRDFVVEARKK